MTLSSRKADRPAARSPEDVGASTSLPRSGSMLEYSGRIYASSSPSLPATIVPLSPRPGAEAGKAPRHPDGVDLAEWMSAIIDHSVQTRCSFNRRADGNR